MILTKEQKSGSLSSFLYSFTMASGDYDIKKLCKQMEQFNIDSKAGKKDNCEQMTPKSSKLMGEKCGWRKELNSKVDTSIFPACKEKGKPWV